MTAYILRFECGTDRDFRMDYAERNPATGVWTCAGQRDYATRFASYAEAQRALPDVSAYLAQSPWRVPTEAWRIQPVTSGTPAQREIA